MGVVDEAVEDGVGVGRLADDGVPAGYRQLAGDDGGASAIAVLEDLKQVMSGLGVQRFQAPVVQDQQLHGGQALEAAPDAAVAMRKGELVEELGDTDVEDRAVVAVRRPEKLTPCGLEELTPSA